MLHASAIAVGLLLCALRPAPSFAQDTESQPDFVGDPDTATRCVSLRAIDKTDILDDGNILFYMRGGEVYVNHLPHGCPGLKLADTFMYRTPIDSICSVDIITVLERLGVSLRPGASCGLGLFYPIDKTLAREMSRRSR
jgi:hypothetical protein